MGKEEGGRMKWINKRSKNEEVTSHVLYLLIFLGIFVIMNILNLIIYLFKIELSPFFNFLIISLIFLFFSCAVYNLLYLFFSYNKVVEKFKYYLLLPKILIFLVVTAIIIGCINLYGL